jgi:hypothetical protein
MIFLARYSVSMMQGKFSVSIDENSMALKGRGLKKFLMI